MTLRLGFRSVREVEELDADEYLDWLEFFGKAE